MMGERRIKPIELGLIQMRSAPAALATSMDISVPIVLSGATTVRRQAINPLYVGTKIKKKGDPSLKDHPPKVET